MIATELAPCDAKKQRIARIHIIFMLTEQAPLLPPFLKGKEL